MIDFSLLGGSNLLDSLSGNLLAGLATLLGSDLLDLLGDSLLCDLLCDSGSSDFLSDSTSYNND